MDALPNGDLDRITRQQAFLTGLIGAIGDSGALADPGKRASLITAVRKYVVLDQQWDLVSFAGQVQKLTQGGVRTSTIPIMGEKITPESGAVIAVDRGQVQDYVAQQFGTSTTATSAPGSNSTAVAPPATSTVDATTPCVD